MSHVQQNDGSDRSRIITENVDDISSNFGLIKCTVLPPRGLFHSVSPYRTKGKFMFRFHCKACADTCTQNPCTHSDRERVIQGTWCRVERKKALEKGYQILHLHEIWHFSKSMDELFRNRGDICLRMR